jgi:hypothetical protein
VAILLTPDETAIICAALAGRDWRTWAEMEADDPELCEKLARQVVDVGLN